MLSGHKLIVCLQFASNRDNWIFCTWYFYLMWTIKEPLQWKKAPRRQARVMRTWISRKNRRDWLWILQRKLNLSQHRRNWRLRLLSGSTSCINIHPQVNQEYKIYSWVSQSSMGSVCVGAAYGWLSPTLSVKTKQRTVKRARVLSWFQLTCYFLGTVDTQCHYSEHIIETGSNICIVIQLYVALAMLW